MTGVSSDLSMHIFIYFFKSANIIKVPFDMSMTMYLVSVAWVGFL